MSRSRLLPTSSWNSPAFLFLAVAASAQTIVAPRQLGVQSVELAEVATDRVRLRVHLAGIAERDVAIRSLTFDEASLNGVPLFAPAVNGPIRLAKGSPFAHAGAVEAMLFYRDLPSLEPIRRMIREEKAVVRATVRLQPELNLLQRIALRTSGAWVSWKLERTVGVQAPGGSAGKVAAELALAGADAVWVAGRRGLDWQRDREAFTRHVRETYAGRVLPVRTTYVVVSKNGAKSNLTWRGLAFHAGSGQVWAPAEAVEPWMFDSGVAEALSAGALEIVPEATDLSAGNFSLRNGTLVVKEVGRNRGKGLSLERRRTFALRDRASEANLARLSAVDLSRSAVTTSTEAGDVAVFRLREDGSTEILMLSATKENGRLRLADPVDSRVFGSPVIGMSGVLGIVVSQTDRTAGFARQVSPAKRL